MKFSCQTKSRDFVFSGTVTVLGELRMSPWDNPAVAHDLLVEVTKKTKPKSPSCNSNSSELCRVFLQEGKAPTKTWRIVQKPTWCQEWVEWSNRLWWLGHQRIQVHQGSVGAQEGLWGFPGRALFARGPTRVLGLKEIRTRGTAVLRRQSGTWFSCNNTKGQTKLLVNAQSWARRSLKCVRAEMLCARLVLVSVSGCYTLSACKQGRVL